MLNKITDLIEKKTIDQNTPYFLFDKGRIVHNFLYFKHILQINDNNIFYSVKANNHLEIIEELNILGTGFDIASLFELQILVNQDIDTNHVIFSNPVKIPKHISIAHKLGVNKFAFDSFSELKKISDAAPKSNVFLRLEINNLGASWTLDNKFGAKQELVIDLFNEAKNLGLIPYGISIHNGWNNTNLNTWKENINQCKELIIKCFSTGIEINSLNIGGGFPTQNIDQYIFLQKLATLINPDLSELIEKYNVNILAEPGSFMVNNTGAMIVKIYDIIKRDNSEWIFIDSGIFQGFPWILNNLRYEILYPYKTDKNTELKEFIITGPTNDSKDVFGKYLLPKTIRINDFLIIYPAGAYTNSANNYNGYKIPDVKFTK
jgi:ornithine decarboxylase